MFQQQVNLRGRSKEQRGKKETRKLHGNVETKETRQKKDVKYLKKSMKSITENVTLISLFKTNHVMNPDISG